MGLVGICPDYKIKCKIKMREIKIKQYFGDLNCAMDKIDRGGGNNKKILHKRCSNYVLSKGIMDNGLEDLWRRENLDSPEFTCYDRSFTKDPG